ncbi:MAG TPA: sugar phosphate isomerase/epimerase family protein [Terriglobia bacterium]|jgi:sugar phosphate isomerase/epimerase|nr:sugar phosphate isomerase/epimerase family protein [Terriglobia bacterium]
MFRKDPTPLERTVTSTTKGEEMKNNRRDFLKLSTAAALTAAGFSGTEKAFAAAGAVPAGGAFASPAPVPAPPRGYEPFALGIITGIGKDPEAAMAKVHSLEMHTCQIDCDLMDDETIERLQAALDKYKIVVTAMGTDGPGPYIYNFYDGPLTLGLIPRTYRGQRIEKLKKFSDQVKKLNVPAIRIHAGFIPEDPNTELYWESVEALKDVVSYCKQNGQDFLYETGTETPITLLRAMKDIGLDNQGVNLDTANLILYGKANPLDALDILGPYVKNTHAKDGLYPTNPRDLGREVAIPHGKVDFPKIIAKLKELNYQGPITIEREISGPQQLKDVKKERDYLKKLIES